MALDKASLISSLTSVFENKDPSITPAQKAEQIADAIEMFVKSGTVTSNGETSPCVPGSPAVISGLNGTIS